jgi:hypothetical protein
MKKQKKDPLKLLEQKLAAMQAKLDEKANQIDLIDKNQKNAEIGRQRYGASEWQSWVSGSEQGYHRSIYVDIKSMLQNKG